MTLNITKTTDPIAVENINVLIYGTPGIGKTSIGCSAKNTLLLDFDKGAHRSAFRSELVRIDDWREIASLQAKDLAQYDTIVIDTIGRALDLLTQRLQDDNPKLKTNTGTLSLQGWGALKATFGAWMAQMRLLGKDVIMLAHDKEKPGDDMVVFRADIQGGSYAEIFKMADSVAYFGTGGEHNRGILDFDPKPEHSGKNPGQITPINVPNLHQVPHFMGDVIVQIKKKLGDIGERGQLIAKEVDEHREPVDAAKSLKAINELATTSNDIEDRAVQAQVKHLIMNRAKQLGFGYDKEKHAFAKLPAKEEAA